MHGCMHIYIIQTRQHHLISHKGFHVTESVNAEVQRQKTNKR